MPKVKNNIACPNILRDGSVCGSKNTRTTRQAYVEVANCQVKRYVCDDCHAVFNVQATVVNVVTKRGEGYKQVAKRIEKENASSEGE